MSASTLTASDRMALGALLGVAIAPFLLNGYLNTFIAHVPLLYWSFELVSWVLIPALAGWIAHRRYGVTWADIGLTWDLRGRRRWGWLFLLCVAGGFSFYWIYSTADAFFGRVFPGTPYFEYETLVPESGAARLLVALWYAASAGIVEEILYRGALFRLLDGLRGSTALYLVLSPVIFASIHWEGGVSSLAATFVVGVFAAVAFLLLRNLWPLIVGHFATDLAWFV